MNNKALTLERALATLKDAKFCVDDGRYQFNCANGCGRCGVELSEFEFQRTETMTGEFVSHKVCPQIVSACCGGVVEVWDEVSMDHMPHKIMAVTIDQLYAPAENKPLAHLQATITEMADEAHAALPPSAVGAHAAVEMLAAAAVITDRAQIEAIFAEDFEAEGEPGSSGS